MNDVRAVMNESLAGRYHLKSELGRGGMGIVFQADDLRHGRQVAVKVLLAEVSSALGSERFQREIEIAAGLNHPAILPLHDSGSAGGQLYYVMPLVEGPSLRDRLTQEKQLSLEEAAAITTDVADALSYAHEHGVVHRDIKPENILLQGGRAVVSDFGIARAIGEAGRERLTESGLALGTPDYMSPEQGAGSAELDGRSDVYSLGCVIYEMLAGTPPYTGATAQAVLARKALEPVPSLRVVRDAVSPALEAVVTKALAKVPADRWGSAREMSRALARAASGQAAPQGRGQQWTVQRRLATAAALVAVIAAGYLWLSSPAVPATSSLPSVAVLPFDNLVGDTGEDYFVAGMHRALIDELSKVEGLRVISGRSTMRYGDSELATPEIARALGVNHVVEGSVARRGDSVSLEIQLIATAPMERQLWARRFGRESEQVLAMHGDIAAIIAGDLGVDLTAADQVRLGTRPTITRETYEAYLRGMYLLNRGSAQDFQEGITVFREAVARDPADPLAYAGLALAFSTVGHSPAATPEVWDEARASATRALTLDSTLAEAWTALGDVKLYHDWDWAGALAAFRKADQLNPNLAMNHYHWAWYHALFDQLDEAIEHHREAQRLDPLTPLHTSFLGQLYYRKGEIRRGIEEAQKSLERTPDNISGLIVLGTGYGLLGQFDSAIAVHRRLAEANPNARGFLAMSYATAGRNDEARQIAYELESGRITSWWAWNLALIYTALGDRDAAFRWLGFRPAHAFLPWIRASNTPWSVLHDDPRFAPLMEEMELPLPGTRPVTAGAIR